MSGFCEKLPESSLCLAEPIPGGSKTDTPLAKLSQSGIIVMPLC